MNLNSSIINLNFKFEEDVCNLSGDNDFLFNFNINQVSNIEQNSNFLKIYIDLDLSIKIYK